MAGAMIEVIGLRKAYGSLRAVDDLSFRVDAREVVAFLGPNGAGKTTTLRILAGYLGADAGQVRVAGYDLAEQPLLARAELGYMPETCPLHPEMRVSEYLRFRAELKRVPARERQAALSRAMSLSGVEHRAQSLIGTLSKGYRQRVGLADALVAKPQVLILDEPTAGLDPNQIREVRGVIQELGREHSVLLSTHILAEAEAACDRAVVISRGKLVAEGPPQSLRGHASSELRAVVVVGDAELPPALARTVIERKPLGSESGLERWRVKRGELAAEEWARQLMVIGYGLREMVPANNLEQVFAELTDDQARGAPDPAGSRDA